MKRLTISTFLAGTVGALVMALLLFSGGHTAHAVTGVTDPVTGSIKQVSIDTNVTNGGVPGPGNLPGTGDVGTGCPPPGTPCVVNLLGPVDPVIANVPLGTTVPVDIIIDEIAPPDGPMIGMGFNLHYNPAIVSINGHSFNYLIGAAGFEPGTVPDPDSSGNWREDIANLAGGHFGEGIGVRVGIMCGNTIGSSTLTLDDEQTGNAYPGVYAKTNTNGDPTVALPVQTVGSATIYCGMAAPQVSDLTVVSTTTTAPASSTAGVSFPVTVNATVHNLGPVGPATGDVTEVLSMPADCTAVGGATTTVTGLALPVSTDVVVPTQTYTVTCTGPSFHIFSATATVAVDPADLTHSDPNSGNNSATSATSTTAVTASADPAITASSATSSAPSQCLPQSPPAPGCSTLPVVTIGATQTVTVHKTINNLSGANPVSVSDAVTWIGAVESPGGANAQNPCVMGPSNTCTWANGTTCIVNPTGANPQTASVGPAVTLNFTFTATCTVDSFFNSHNPQAVTLLFQDVLTPTDSHITDTNPGNNVVAPITLPFWNRSVFTPSFSMIIDDTPPTNAPLPFPSLHTCKVSGAPYPAMTGVPCSMGQTTSIPGNQPLALATVITPASFSFANGLTVPNGTVTGAFGFSVQILSCPSLTDNVNVPYPAVTLLDGALPDHTTVGDPPGNLAEGPDMAGGTTAILTNPAVWPTNLNSDPGVQAIVATGAVIWERYTAIAPGTGTPVNILVFNGGPNGWITTTVTGDPLGPPTPPGSQCTPFTTKTDYFGSTATGQVLRQCDVVGPKVFVANWTRADDFETIGPPTTSIPGVTLDLTNSCIPSDTSVTLTKAETLGGVTVAGSPNGGVTYTQTVTANVVGTSSLTMSITGPAVCNVHWTNPLDSFPSIIGGVETSVVTIPAASGVVTLQYSFTCPPGDYTFQIVANLLPIGSENTANNQFENHVLVHVVPGCGEAIPCAFSGTNVDTITTTACVMSGLTPVNCDATVAGTTTGGGIMVPNGPFTGALHDDWTVYTASAPCAAVTGTLTGTGWSGTLNPGAFFCEVVAGSTYSFHGTIQLNGTPGGALLVSMACTHTSGTTPATNVYTCTSTFSGGDQCPGVNDPESGGPDPSDTTPSNGCPDTNVSVTAVKEENYNVDVSVDTHKTVQIVVSNSEYPANVVVNITAISLVGQCEVRLTPHAGDTYSEYFTTEPAGNTLTSQVSFVIPNMPVGTQTFTYTYTIHCFQKSFHPSAFELQIDALPQAPVVEENLGGNPITDPTNPNNNVAKNFPNVTAWENANLSKSGCTTTSPATVAAGLAYFNVSQTCTITNNGPAAADYTDTATIVVPADCTLATATPATQSSSASLASGAHVNVGISWTVICTAPSNHTFTVNDVVSINPTAGMLHVKDSDLTNNTGTSSSTTAVTTTTDASVSGVQFMTCSPGTTVNVGQTVTCTENETVALGLATGGTLTSTLSVPSDCVISSPNPVTQAAVNGTNAASFSFSCTNSSNHTISKTVCLTPTLPLHVTDTNAANNCGSATGVVTVIANANLAITVSNASPVDLTSGSSTVINPVVTITNTGDAVPVSWTVTITSGGAGTVGCTVTGVSQVGGPTAPVVIPPTLTLNYTATITMPAGDVHECGYTITATANATGVHNVGTATTTSSYILETNVLVVKYNLLVGPAAVNLSDTNGRYMWVISEIGNVSTTDELVRVNMSILDTVPAGCTSTTSQILPGQLQFMLSAGEQKVLVWRVRYECHAPALAQLINQTVTVGVTHCDLTTSDLPLSTPVGTVTPTAPGGICSTNSEPGYAAGDVETVLSDNIKTTTRQVIIQ